MLSYSFFSSFSIKLILDNKTESANPRPTGGSPTDHQTYDCIVSSVEIVVPDSLIEGEQCFLHVIDSNLGVRGFEGGIPYKLCCPSTCGELNICFQQEVLQNNRKTKLGQVSE